VQAGMNHFRIARADFRADPVVPLQDQCLATRTRESPRDGQPDHSCADDDTLSVEYHPRFLEVSLRDIMSRLCMPCIPVA